MRTEKQQSLLSCCMESVRISKRLVHVVVVACLFFLWPCPTTIQTKSTTTESSRTSTSSSTGTRRRTSGIIIIVEAFVQPSTYSFGKKTSSRPPPASSSIRNHGNAIRLHEHRPLALYPIGHHLHHQQEQKQQQQRKVQQPQQNKQPQQQLQPPVGLYPMGYNLQREQQQQKQRTFQQQQQQQQVQGIRDTRRPLSPSSLSRRNELDWLQQGKVRLVVRQYGVGPCFMVNLVGDSTPSATTTLEEPQPPKQPAPPRQWPPPPLPLTYTRKPIPQSQDIFLLQDDIVVPVPGRRTQATQPEQLPEEDEGDDETNVVSSPFFGVATESNAAPSPPLPQAEYVDDDDNIDQQLYVEQVNGSYGGTSVGVVVAAVVAGGDVQDQDEWIAIEGNTETELLDTELDSLEQVTDSYASLSAWEDKDDEDEEEVDLVESNSYSMPDMEAQELAQFQLEQQYSMDEEEVPNLTTFNYDNPINTAETEDMGDYDSEQVILFQTEELQQLQLDVVGEPALMEVEECEETIARAPDLQSAFTLVCPTEDEIALEENQRLICVGDVHGDFPALQELLTVAKVYDRRRPSGQEWVGGNTIVVQCGDVLDRGTEELACFSLLTKLSRQAAVAGGHVMILFGNHEVLNAAGLFHYTNGDAEYEVVLGDALDDTFCSGDQWRQDYGFHQPARWAAYEPGGYLSHPLMKNLKVAVKVGRTICVHAGLTAQHVEEHGGLSAMNRDAQEWMAREVGSKQEPAVSESDCNDANDEEDYETAEEEVEDDAPVATDDMDIQNVENDGEEIVEEDGESDEFTTEDVKEWVDVAARQASTYKTIPSILGGKNADQSPIWMRDYSAPPNLPPKNGKFAQAMINDCLDLLDCDRMVMGHTVQREINCALGGKAWRIDVGASRGVLGGTPEVLEIVKINGTEVVSVLSMHYGKVPEEERQVFGIDLTSLF
jgi:hypothetical protein